MKIKHLARAAVFYLIGYSVIWTSHASANLIFSDLQVTDTIFSIDISGTLPNLAVSDRRLFVFESNPLNTSPGWVLDAQSFVPASSFGFSGTQASIQFWTGSPSFGDYIFHRFNTDLNIGEAISGTLSGTWTNPAFDPSALGSIDIYWGGTSNAGGSLVGSAMTGNVPAPATLVLFGLGLAGLGWSRRKKR